MLHHTRRGFTLVELLWVIAIIAVLAAVTLPAILSAIKRSEQSACAQHLRQWGLAQLQFVTDNGHYSGCNASTARTRSTGRRTRPTPRSTRPR